MILAKLGLVSRQTGWGEGRAIGQGRYDSLDLHTNFFNF